MAIEDIIFWLKPLGRDFCNGNLREEDTQICLKYQYYSFMNDFRCKYLTENKQCSYDKNNFWR